MVWQNKSTTSTRCSTSAISHTHRRFVKCLHASHASLAAAIEGLTSANERARYASLLLHRLMFLYFLQQKGLLAHDTRYLQHRLAQQSDEYGYYRDVLTPLFVTSQQPDDFPTSMASLFIQSAQLSPTISLPNAIFTHIFTLFDEYCWHIGTSDKQADTMLGPEILEILFEGEGAQKELGAYYTPETVTSYITHNTLLPALFTRAQTRCQDMGIRLPTMWRAPQPAHYLSATARKGYEQPLPPAIAAGLHDVHQRQIWQETGATAYALPGETWREVIARRAYIQEIETSSAQNETDCLNRFVTWNLDQQQFALDILRRCRQPGFLAAFYQSLRTLTILDPTCGSGAFLLAALTQLEPLYLASLARMEKFLATGSQNHAYAHLFRAYLAEAGPPEQRSATVSSWIVEHNLYGVDVISEAVELCRQRLFLQILANQPDLPSPKCGANVGLHIRVGNSLTGSLGSSHVAQVHSPPSHQAFHWQQEFPTVMQRGGFDAVIGNPPYVKYEHVLPYYTVEGYATQGTGNLYALTMERSLHLLAPGGRFGMIVPASATCTNGYRTLQQQLLAQQELHIASFSDQRGRLFDIPHPRLCIICCEKAAATETRPCRVFTTPYLKVEHSHETTLFERLRYTEVTQHVRPGTIPRYGSVLERAIHTKLARQAQQLGAFLDPRGEYAVYFTRKLSWFVQVTPFVPLILDEQGQTRMPSELKTLRFTSPIYAHIAFAALNSNLFYWLITTSSDCRNLNAREVLGLPLDLASMSPTLQQELCQLAKQLEQDLQAHAEMKAMTFRGKGSLIIQCMHPAHSKPLIDEVDRVLAQHYGFHEQELDFLLHYDSKYRLTRKNGKRTSR